jgi:hypothetical protein
MELTPDSAEFKEELIKGQLGSLIIVGLAFLFWAFVEKFWPSYFSPFEWSQSTSNVLLSILAFWPIFLWAGFWSLLSCSELKPRYLRTVSAEDHLFLDSITSVLAGLWEELAYRCVFILTAMIGIAVMNFVWSWAITIAAVILILVCLAHSKGFLALIVAGLGAVLLYYTWGLNDPLYWFYQSIVFPILSFFSFRLLDPILYHEAIPFLAIAGMVSANASFRDGHKYQGLFGLLNAWTIGYILLYAMVFHGLWVAILVHALYDLEIAVIRYIGRKST